jgi:uncharacterized protein
MSFSGVLIYFTTQSGDLSNEPGKVEKAGGKIIIPGMRISIEIGYMALFTDSRGNRIALHSRK